MEVEWGGDGGRVRGRGREMEIHESGEAGRWRSSVVEKPEGEKAGKWRG